MRDFLVIIFDDINKTETTYTISAGSIFTAEQRAILRHEIDGKGFISRIEAQEILK